MFKKRTFSEWMAEYRPDGVGRIGITTLDENGKPKTEILSEFTEVVCDFCNDEIKSTRQEAVDGGDLVDCMNCDFRGEIPKGADTCPQCKEPGDWHGKRFTSTVTGLIASAKNVLRRTENEKNHVGRGLRSKN